MKEQILMRYIKLSITQEQYEFLVDVCKTFKKHSLVDKLRNAYTNGSSNIAMCKNCLHYDDPCDPEGCSLDYVDCDSYDLDEKKLKDVFGMHPDLPSLKKGDEEL